MSAAITDAKVGKPSGLDGRHMLGLYAIEAMATVGGTFMSIGIFFFMQEHFGWQNRQNFMLAAAQGAVYIPGALLAEPITARLGKRSTLAGIYGILGLLTLVACLAASHSQMGPQWVVISLLAYTFTIGISWPILEGLVASGGSSAGLARRLSIYNVIWPAGGAMAFAAEGTILKYWISGLFLIPGMLHVLALVFLFAMRQTPVAEASGSDIHAIPIVPEAQLLRKRKLALWLSRTALPATYTVIYGLMPMMPSMHVIQQLPTTLQTVVASIWLATRWIAFILLALGTWWHTRPRVLLWAAVAMLVAFFGMTLSSTGSLSPKLGLYSLIGWQVVLGLALGMIYSASLYFGMVLSDGSTEHGGYHEALIGLGWALGPAAGAGAQALQPQNQWIGIDAVGCVIASSVIIVLIIGYVLNPARRGDER